MFVSSTLRYPYKKHTLFFKNGTGTPVDEFSNEYKNILQQLPDYESDLETEAPFIQYMYPQGGQQKSICIGLINRITKFDVDIPGGDTEIPIAKSH